MMAGAGLSAAAWLVAATVALGHLRRGEADAAQPYLIVMMLLALAGGSFAYAAGLLLPAGMVRP